MSGRVAKLEALLGRVQSNRRAAPAKVALGGAARATPVPVRAAEPEPQREPITDTIEVPTRALKPTPMEMALETIDAPAPSIAQPSIAQPSMREPAVSEPSVDVEITLDEGPEITIEADGEEVEEAVPTAPVETRAPVEQTEKRAVVEEPAKPASGPRAPTRQERRTPSIAQERAPVAGRPIELAPPAPSAPVARVVSRAAPAEPTTFGELLERTLALRPRS